MWLYGIGPEHFNTVQNILNGMGFKGNDGWLKDEKNGKHDKNKNDEKSVYERQAQYSSIRDRTSIQILHKHKKKLPYKESMSLRIHDPSKDFAYTFHYHLTERNINYIVNRLELTFDFYSNCPATMESFLDRHLYSRTRVSSKNTEEHLPRRSSTGSLSSKKWNKPKNYFTKLYLKWGTRGGTCVRLELVMGRVPIKKHGFGLRLNGVESIDLSKYFKFMRLDERKITDFYIRKFSTPPPPPDIEMSDLRRRFEVSGMMEGEFMRGVVFQDSSLLGRLSELKKMGFPNYSRFMKPLTDFQETFNAEISKQEFLKPMDFDERDFLYEPKGETDQAAGEENPCRGSQHPGSRRKRTHRERF